VCPGSVVAVPALTADDGVVMKRQTISSGAP